MVKRHVESPGGKGFLQFGAPAPSALYGPSARASNPDFATIERGRGRPLIT